MNQRTTTVRLLMALALTLLLAACGGGDGDGDGTANGDGDGATGGAGDYTLATREFTFTPDSLTVPADTEVAVTVDNSAGVIEHDFTLDDADVTILAQPGQSADGSFTVPAGTYTFYCSVPGHRDSGMEGTLTAE